ncbi:hypothetical protein CALCODRAFT_491249 [Calocera cornea HHB12733]|uniref:Uncharacterized protein n=1 Tax=Calocera cornea HHB12733 TaxID=1353952 RepID=A0A165J6H1_9BASI|nr:hypothetical protein CALCODRAFT_491249 [Calocera cornea HHB12733]
MEWPYSPSVPRGVQLPSVSVVASGIHLPPMTGNRLPALSALNNRIPRLPHALPPVPAAGHRVSELSNNVSRVRRNDPTENSEASSSSEDCMELDSAESQYSASPPPTPVHTRLSSPASDIDSDMRRLLRTAERAFFAESEPGTCSPVGSPVLSQLPAPASPSSHRGSVPRGTHRLPTASQASLIPAKTPHHHTASRHIQVPSCSAERAPYSKPGHEAPFLFSAGFLPPPPNQSARRTAQDAQRQKRTA